MTDKKTFKVNVSPLNKIVEVSEEMSLLDGLKKADVFVKSSCGGVGTCSDCKIKIRFGEDLVTAPTFNELKLLGNVFHITKERLSCQTKLCGDISIDVSEHTRNDGSYNPTASAAANNMKRTQVRTILKKSHQVQEENKLKEVEKSTHGNNKKQNDKSWFRHWENTQPNNSNENSAGNEKVKKKLGGNKRPKKFYFKDEEN